MKPQNIYRIKCLALSIGITVAVVLEYFSEINTFIPTVLLCYTAFSMQAKPVRYKQETKQPNGSIVVDKNYKVLQFNFLLLICLLLCLDTFHMLFTDGVDWKVFASLGVAYLAFRILDKKQAFNLFVSWYENAEGKLLRRIT